MLYLQEAMIVSFYTSDCHISSIDVEQANDENRQKRACVNIEAFVKKCELEGGEVGLWRQKTNCRKTISSFHQCNMFSGVLITLRYCSCSVW